MRTSEQIEKKLNKLERRLKLLNKYKDEINFGTSNAKIPASDYLSYEKDIRFVEGQIKAIYWVIDGDSYV